MLKIYEKQKSYLIYAIIIVFGIMMLMINILNLFFAQKMSYACKQTFLLNNIILLILETGICTMICFIIRKVKYKKKEIVIASIGLFFLEIFISYHIGFLPGWDVETILNNAWNIAFNQIDSLSNDYFSSYPNNLLLVGIFSSILKIGKSFAFLIVLQCFLYCLAGYLLFNLIFEYTEKVWLAWLGWILYIILVEISGWIVVPYSDSMGVVFPIFTLYVYINTRKKESKIFNVVIFACIAFLSYHIKPQTIIVSIAIILVEILELLFAFNKRRIIKSIVSLIIIYIVFLLGNGFLNIWAKEMGYQINWEMQKEWPHYLMMGLNIEEGGVYSVEDNVFSGSFLSRAERKKANLQKAKERVKRYGIVGLIDHEIRKMLVNFGDGTFLFGIEGGDRFCIKIEPEKNPIITPFLRDIFYKTGKYYDINACIKQGCWILVLFSMLGNITLLFQKKITREELVLLVSIIGFILFQMLFEARSRYMLVYTTILILCAMNGISKLFTIYSKKTN